MEFVVVCGVVLVAAIVVVVRGARQLRAQGPPCCSCDSCPHPEIDRAQCAGASTEAGTRPPETSNGSMPGNTQ